MNTTTDIGPGVAFSVSLIRQLAADARREQPTDQTRFFCLTDAAKRLEQAALQHITENRADLFGPRPAQAAE